MKLSPLGPIAMTSSPLVNATGQAIMPKVHQRNPTIEDFNFPAGLPTADDLPCSDGKPVDSILQELIPGLLKAILLDIWSQRSDWLFGIDLGFYYHHKGNPVSPDGMLCLGVRDYPDENMRPSYVLWEELVLPIFVMEVVSKTAGRERTKKMDIYESIGILYYVIYAPLRKRGARFELYKLTEGKYELQSQGQEPYWMPEIGLGIGPETRKYSNREREWLFWYNADGDRYPTPTERAEAERQKAAAERQRAETEKQRADLAEREIAALRQRLRDLGLDSDT
jgi:Uma2 family endonuclease